MYGLGEFDTPRPFFVHSETYPQRHTVSRRVYPRRHAVSRRVYPQKKIRCSKNVGV